MRRLLVAFGLMGGVLSPALAADFDALPASVPVQPIAPVTTVGPATFTRWSGFYGGGTFSYGHATTNFSGATQPLVAYSLRGTTFEIEAEPSQLPVLGNGDSSAFGYGGFLGYNTQWQDLVIGFEANYTHTSLDTTASPSPVGPLMQTVAGATYNYNISGTGNLDLTDYASIRGRAGWVIGNLLPYALPAWRSGGQTTTSPQRSLDSKSLRQLLPPSLPLGSQTAPAKATRCSTSTRSALASTGR